MWAPHSISDRAPIDLLTVLDVSGDMKVPINSRRVFWKSLEITVKQNEETSSIFKALNVDQENMWQKRSKSFSIRIEGWQRIGHQRQFQILGK